MYAMHSPLRFTQENQSSEFPWLSGYFGEPISSINAFFLIKETLFWMQILPGPRLPPAE